jgi:hypothetical protein
MLAAPKVVMFLFTGVAAQTRFRDLFGRFIFEGDDLLRIAFLTVGFAWTMAGLATGHLLFPAADFDELSVGSLRERFELIFVAILASLTAYVVLRFVCWNFALRQLSRV